ncbi:MAG: hypothetical protein IKO85_03870 [Bacteroidaceae bacterium]|nr:hypothetical protein [Bacteroidaceae bacterium]
MEKRNPTQHRMTRRAAAHDYSAPGLYHITLHVAEALGQPLGRIVGDLSAPDGTPSAPHPTLSPIGQMVEHELLTAIAAHYPMIEIQDYIIMPEHLHFILEVHSTLITQNGKQATLGQVIAGFKKGCNRHYWEITGQQAASQQGKLAGTNKGAFSTPSPAAPQIAPDAPAIGGEDAARDDAARKDVTGVDSARKVAARKDAAGNDAAQKDAAGVAAVVGAPAVFPQVVSSSPAAQPATSAQPATFKVPGTASTGRPSLFASGYCDVMPLHGGQLATQRQYIKDNPRSRLLRMSNREQLTVRRGGIATALTPAALRGYLQRECPPHLATVEALAAIEDQLLITTETPTGIAGGKTASHTVPSGFPAGQSAPAGSNTPSSPAGNPRFITCDTFGNRALLTERRLLPVVCHRRDTARFGEQKARCLDAAAQGAVLISACISPKEREIINESVHRGFPTIVIHDNGFTDRYHPSAESLALCVSGRLLFVSPWKFQYRGKDEQVTVPLCKAMNCVAQALCRTKDSWWKVCS